MANEWAEQKLPTGVDGKTRPAVFDDAKGDNGEWEVVKGRDGRMWVRDDNVESQLKKLNKATESNKVDFPDDFPDKDVKAELESIKSTQTEILERLDGTFDTQLTGSIVEDALWRSEVIMAGSNKATDYVLYDGMDEISVSVDSGRSDHKFEIKMDGRWPDSSQHNITLKAIEGRKGFLDRTRMPTPIVRIQLNNRSDEDQVYNVSYVIFRR